MDIDPEVVCMINYFIRSNLYGSAARLCDDASRRVKDSRQLNVLRAYCLAKIGKTADAIRMLNSLVDEPDLELATFTCLKIAYLNESVVDKESVRNTEARAQAAYARSHDRGAFLTGSLLMFEGMFERAKPLIDRVANSNTHLSTCMAQKGWLDVLWVRDLNAAMTCFETAIQTDKAPDGFLGKIRLQQLRHNIAEMKATTDALIEQHPMLLAGYVELINILVMTKQWDQIADAAQQATLIQSDCIPVQLVEALDAIVVRGNADVIESVLAELSDSVNKTEASNGQLVFHIARFLASVAMDNETVRTFANRFVDKALQLNRTEEAVALKAELLLADNDPKTAMKTAVSAIESQSLGSPAPLFALIKCYLAESRLNDAITQMEFLKASFSNIDQDTGVPFGVDYLRDLNPTLLMELAERLFELAPLAPTAGGGAGPALREAERTLGLVWEQVRGSARPAYLLAKAKHLMLEEEAAHRLLRACLDKNNGLAEAHLLMAQIHLQKNNLEEASKCLDVGLGFNFKVRDHPIFYLVKSRLLKKERKMEEALLMLRSTLDLPAFLGRDTSLQRLEVTESDRISIYLELIDLLQVVGKNQEADEIMKTAVKKYQGKPEEHQLVLMNAQLRLQRGDIDGAIRILEAVQPDQPNYHLARMKMAQIYLEHKHDRIRFAKCYKAILDKNNSPQTYVLLGDAYMSIQEPTNAIEAYETAMRRNPNDYELAVKIGNAYVQCHLYNKAINFYEAAMKKSRQPMLRLRFAEQLLRLGNFEKCERVLRDVIDEGIEPAAYAELADHVKFWSLLSRMHFEAGDLTPSVTAQQKARALQMKVLGMVAGQVPDLAAEKQLASGICTRLAELHASRREWAKSVELYKEVIALNERDFKGTPNPEPGSLDHFHLQTMVRLAHVYMSMGKLQQCNQQCQAVVQLDRHNNEVTLMLADLMYQRNEGEQALKHFSQLLDRNPTHYHALARYIELGWRKGDLEHVEKYVKSALEHNPRATADAGFNYCKALIEWYSGEPNAALQAFNRARRDLEWGERAIYNMIEICMNPDNEIIGGEVFEHDDQTESREIAVKTAERFLKELRHKPGLDDRYRLMENFIRLASGNKANIQVALNNFLEIAGGEHTINSTMEDKSLNVGAVLGIARAYMLLKQNQKAKQFLKKVHTYPWSLEDADYLQQCWLLLADLYINQGKNEQATAVLRTVLQHNASATKAYEYMGFLREREQKWADAAAHFELAWRLCRRRHPAVGYKLAYNYLKSRRLLDCIDTCHAVLQMVPDYPKVKKEILDKARGMIRT